MALTRCRDCGLFDRNSSVVVNNEQPKDPDKGICRAKLPQAALIMTAQGPNLVTFQPEVHKDGGCGEGLPTISGMVQ